METKILDILAYCLPAIITGGVAYLLFTNHLKNESNRRKFQLLREKSKETIPLRLQAYERMALFLERINPSKLLLRVAPFNDNKHDYENFLIQQIEQEFEHNLTQQVYISEDCWTILVTAKNTIIQNIRKTNMSEKVDSAHKLREVILSDLLDTPSPTAVALSYLKNEVVKILG